MGRLECFEKMLSDIQKQAEHEQAEMEKLKMEGKESCFCLKDLKQI